MISVDKPVKIIVLGSTGSIGTQVLDIARFHNEKVTIIGLTAHSNWELLADQVAEFKPEFAALSTEKYRHDFTSKVGNSDTEFAFSMADIIDFIRESDADIVLNSFVGYAGFEPTLAALQSGKKVALANKESLVVGGELLKPYLGLNDAKLIPVDSEHSAIFQCLVGEPTDSVEKLIITASGGPFRKFSKKDLENVTVETALKHPNWSMGAKITIDSSTMMNKGLEIIEAYWLFGLPLGKIDAVIHPQSIVHSMVTFADGSTKAQLGLPDMRVPIQYALTFPNRWEFETPRIDWSKSHEWNFEPIDTEIFPCFAHALESIQMGGFAPAILNASNEVAVSRFLNREIPYIAISKIVQKCLEEITCKDELTASSIQVIDSETRRFATKLTI
jgi:1-deoxy-D-xylulose-5-phosphate reductoisomerase